MVCAGCVFVAGNVRIFRVHAMKCMCAQTRPRFTLSSERVFWGMEFEPMLTPREKSPIPENLPRGGLNPRHCGQRAQTLLTSYSGTPAIDPNLPNLHGSFAVLSYLTQMQVADQTCYLTHSILTLDQPVPAPTLPHLA